MQRLRITYKSCCNISITGKSYMQLQWLRLTNFALGLKTVVTFYSLCFFSGAGKLGEQSVKLMLSPATKDTSKEL